MAYKDDGHTFKELFEVFKIPAATYYNWKNKLKQGTLDVKVKQTRRRKIDPEELKRVVEEKPDAYLWEIAAKFDCSIAAVHKRLKDMKIKIKYKKRRLHVQKNPRN